MNFPSFGGHFATALPTIHQFAAKLTQGNVSTSLCPPSETNQRYTANGIPTFTQHHHANPQQLLGTVNASKFQNNYLNQTIYSQSSSINGQEKRQIFEPQELAQELCAVMLQQSQHQEKQKDKIKQLETRSQPTQNQQRIATQQSQIIQDDNQNQNNSSTLSSAWQSLSSPTTTTVANYLSHLPTSLSIHHFLKYSTENFKKDNNQQLNIQNNGEANILQNNNVNLNLNTPNFTSSNNLNTGQIQNTVQSKKKKKKPEKERKPRPKPGEIRLTTALDGSTLYCCPECHMAYPEKELLEQHLVGHTLERRFVCDICGAGLKRKDHLTRHKQSHNPERPYVCTVCLKAFKRKEQLTLHFVIHSGEKRHMCPECGKGFYRKDHLRKHTRSHIARRVKAELSQQSTSQALHLQVPAPTASNNLTISPCILP
ncbi:zinc finger protein 41-like [Diorhabda carinulata]|uniref:zinc finger protein 41-like n=1 Tax=Diorhabda carinulata TaxID=1163345 RepID=UPI0025A2C2D9|nr:zinc finger protein 41-like [Diorhabda carinulata]